MKTSQTTLHFGSALAFVLFYNTAFFRHVVTVYPSSLPNLGFLASLAVGLAAILMLLLTLIGWRFATKPILALLFVLSAITAYFMNNYDVVIDHTMIQNITQTNFKEAADLLSVKLGCYALFLGILPAVVVSRIEIKPVSWEKEILTKARVALLCVLVVLGLVLLFSKFYASFFREHKPLRYYTNPTYALYSLGKYLNRTFTTASTVVRPLGKDAHIPVTDTDRELIILVVGEAARADRFSLNGYPRPTNLFLQQEDVISFSNMYSSGTSTAFSVPCMFSIYPRDQFSEQKGKNTENLLDVLRHAGVNVLWRDNNSDSKGVALRVPYQDYKQPGVNTVCEDECRDEGMLVGLQEYIDAQQQGDILIVLHQMGNHGPAYFKRYPAAYERFTPACQTNQLNECTNEEIGNAYDNAVLYTDAFLARVIALLKKNSPRFETAMVYVSDHGESLGEYGIYLHGLPYAMAPETQKHIASIMWFGDSFKIDKQALRDKAASRFSHDNLFHTLLGLFEIETAVYNQQLDIVHNGSEQRREPSPARHMVNQKKAETPSGPQLLPADGRPGYNRSSTLVPPSLPMWLLIQLALAKR